MKNQTTLITVLIAVVALGAGFGGGFAFKNYQLQQVRGNFANGNFQRGARTGMQNGGMRFGGAVMGTILSMDEKGITVKLMDGSSKIVFFSDATTYSSTTKASKTDLKVDSNVSVFGAPNSDGSVTASSVQLNPISASNK